MTGLVLLCVSLFLVFEKKYCSQADTVPATSGSCKNSINNDLIVEEELQRIFSKCCGYTLIGEKPISIEHCCRLEFCSNLEYKKQFFVLLERLFENSDRFLLKTIHIADFYSEIMLIDKPVLAKLIKKNRYLSSFVKKEYGSIKNFYQSLKDPNLHVVDCFLRDNVAIGIALGYGEGNSRYYQRYLDVGYHLKKYPLICLLPFEPKPMPEMITPEPIRCSIYDIPYEPFVPKIHGDEFESLEDEWRWMRRVRNKDYDETEVPYLFQLPFFISKKGRETDAICRRYSRARDKLAKVFCGKKFSDVIAEEAAKNSAPIKVE